MTLHMWTQVIGKIRLTLSPWINHSWHVTLYVTSRGLTTSPIPYEFYTFEIRFDFIDHELRILKSDGATRTFKLQSQSVAKFYEAVMKALNDLELPVEINVLPNEIPNPFRLIVTRSTTPTIPNMPTGYGRFSFKAIGCLRSFDRVFAANVVRCISFGAASTSR